MDKRDEQFREMMKSYRPPKAPVDFSKKVMEQINVPETSKVVYKPVLGKWFIRFMIGGFLSFILYAILGGGAEPLQRSERIGSLIQKFPKTDLDRFNQLGQHVGELINGLPPVLLFTLLAATLLLLLDVLILKRFRDSLAS